MTEELFSSPDGQRYIKRQTPMGRGGKPEKLLGAILLLASDASSFITGQTIVVDGGWTVIQAQYLDSGLFLQQIITSCNTVYWLGWLHWR